MNWCTEFLNRLAEQPICGYRGDDAPATEPTALAALALLAADRTADAERALHWLAQLQAADGSVGVRPGEPTPKWPSGLAVLAWVNGERGGKNSKWQEPVARALTWMIGFEGKTQARTDDVGHDPMLKAWPWVEGTHAWIEPTAFHVLALKVAGRSQHPRVREAVRMLLDRQLPGGGCNYGNTFILGQKLRPHVQPTGIALLALVGETDARARIVRSVSYLRRAIEGKTTPVSLSWALLGLAAHQQLPEACLDWLSQTAERTEQRGTTPYVSALLCLAALQCREPQRPVLTETVPHRPQAS